MNKEKNLKISLFSNFRSIRLFEFLTIFVCFVFFFKWDPHVHFSSFLDPFQPRNNLFCPGFNLFYLK